MVIGGLSMTKNKQNNIYAWNFLYAYYIILGMVCFDFYMFLKKGYPLFFALCILFDIVCIFAIYRHMKKENYIEIYRNKEEELWLRLRKKLGFEDGK